MSEWKECKLKDITSRITKGTTPSTLGGGFVSKGINYIKSESVSYDGKIDKSSFVYIDQITHDKLKRSQLEKNDILYSMAGIYLGKSGFVTEDILPANTNQALAIIRVNPLCAKPKFIHFILQQKSVIDYVNTISGQSAQPNINMEEIGSIDLLLPSLPEQESIAEVLSSLDDKIELLHRNNKTLEELAETLFRKWFEEEAESDWADVPYSQILNIKYGKNLPTDKLMSEGYPVYGGNGRIGFYNSYIYESSQVLVSCRGEASGKVNIAEKMSFVTNNSLVLEIPAFSHLTFEFLKYHALSTDFTLYVTGSAQPQITISELNNAKIKLPPSQKILDFSSIIKPLVNKIEINSVQINQLELIRDSLLPKLMNGTIRVVKD